MSSPGYYRDEAARCRDLAARSKDADAIKRWLQMAIEYEQLAESLASASRVVPSTRHVQHTAMQQQQSQPKPDVEE
jgi:hypothetical protein